VGLFGRRKDDGLASAKAEADGPDASEHDTSEVDPQPLDRDSRVEGSDRANGPWDADEDYPNEMRIDLGALLVPQRPDIRIQVQADPSSGSVSQLSLVTNTSAVQIQPYAAPRTAGMWDEIRGQIKSSINKSGGLVEEVQGTFGTELRAQVTAQDGKAQPARFCGIDGPRWFVRMVFLGQAAREAQVAAPLEEMIRSMVVVRGGEAMPMGNALALRVPQDQTQESTIDAADATDGASTNSQAPQRPPITLPQRGPEITETR
jgi:hypothetical protein